MLRTLFFSALFLIPFGTFSQIISLFEFDTPSITTATVGPDASSISSSAFSDVGGAGGTNGLNAGLPKQDLDMMVPGSPTFDINGIDVSFDFQRDENVGNFWRRGNSLVIRGATFLSVSYRVDDGAGGFITVNSGDVYAIPNDDIYRNYRFVYLPTSGTGMLMVDNVTVWSNDGPDFRNMYWVGAGDVHIGDGLDGNGDNGTFLDNVLVAEVLTTPLPVELKDFQATVVPNMEVLLSWTTLSERENDFFTVERTQDGFNWEKVGTISGAGNSTEPLYYELKDYEPYIGISYYRLKQTDFDGKETVFEEKRVEIISDEKVQIYPNPANSGSLVRIKADGIDPAAIQIADAQGKMIPFESSIQSGEVTISTAGWAAGLYVISVQKEEQFIQKRLILR